MTVKKIKKIRKIRKIRKVRRVKVRVGASNRKVIDTFDIIDNLSLLIPKVTFSEEVTIHRYNLSNMEIFDKRLAWNRIKYNNLIGLNLLR